MKLAGQRGVEITIEVDDKALQEYESDDITSTNQSHGVKYVELVEGAKFSINCRLQRDQLRPLLSGDVVSAEIYCDGKLARSPIIDVLRQPQTSSRFRGITYQQDGQAILHPFVFAPLQTDDRSTQGLLPQQFVNLGEIRIDCHFRRTISKTYSASDRRSTQIGMDRLPEKCLKGRAISNQISLGESEPTARVGSRSTVSDPYGNQPFASFVFRYRSRRDLQIEGIIPRTPSPVPLEERDPDGLTPDEIRELMARLRANAHTHIKQENAPRFKKEKREHDDDHDDGDDDDDDDEPVITSVSNKRARLSTDSDVEVIDLTD